MIKDKNRIEIDGEEAIYMLDSIEKSLDIKFAATELDHISKYGEFLDAVFIKIGDNHADDCTSQQAFYQLRNVLVSVLGLERKNILPMTFLKDIMPRRNRLKIVRCIEHQLGMSISILRAPYIITTFLWLTILSSMIMVWSNWWLLCLTTLIISSVGIKISNKYGKELRFKTVGQFVESMTRDNYKKSRRNPESHNREEVEKIVATLFGLDKHQMTRDAVFV
jgi:hypothetical protein